MNKANHALQKRIRALAHPVNQLTASTLVRWLEQFEAGYLRDSALLWELIEQRDDMARAVISKRKKAVARHGWEILSRDNLSASEQSDAAEQAAALRFF